MLLLTSAFIYTSNICKKISQSYALLPSEPYRVLVCRGKSIMSVPLLYLCFSGLGCDYVCLLGSSVPLRSAAGLAATSLACSLYALEGGQPVNSVPWRRMLKHERRGGNGGVKAK
jgi:hypothetical protein